jgi:hypothetical protein
MQSNRGQSSVCPRINSSLRIFLLLTILLPQIIRGRPAKTALIDASCLTIRNEFLEATPAFFSGPDPWVQLDRLPHTFPDAAIAAVYSEGPRIKWVVLEMQGPDNAWYEITNYFFDESGLLQKRERRLDQYSSHIQVSENFYFENRKRIKTSFHHQQLSENNSAEKDKENWDTFYDPDAPLYTSTADLPVPFLKVEFKQLASFINIESSNPSSSLLKFTRLVIFKR